MKDQIEVWIAIPAAYNPGECAIYQQRTGPRGGKTWVKIFSAPATGGMQQLFLTPGNYKRTHWVNGWPRRADFTVTRDGIEWQS